jgi:hypothetical protein
VLPPQSGDAPGTSVVPSNSAEGAHPGAGTLVPIGPMYPMPSSLAWPGAAPVRPSFLTSGPDPITLLHAFRRRWLPALACGIAAALVVAAIAWFVIPADYEVQALFEVRQKEDVDVIAGASGHGSRDEHDLFKKSQQTLVKSQFVIQSALRREEIAQLPSIKANRKDPVKFLTDEILVDYPGGADILRIRMKGENADELVKLVDAVKDAYIREVVNKDKEFRLKKRNTLDEEFRAISSKLTQRQKDEINVSGQLKAASSDQVQFQMQILISELQAQRREEHDKQREIIAASQKIEEIKALKQKAESAAPSAYALYNVLSNNA